MTGMPRRPPDEHPPRGNHPQRGHGRPPRPRRSAMAAAAIGVAVGLTAVACSAVGSPGGSLATGAGPPGASRLGTGTGAGLSWHSCTQVPRMQCARLRVPLDYRHPATAPPGQRQGVLLVNPGGPGASGLSLTTQVAGGLDPNVAAEYDIVGFDP